MNNDLSFRQELTNTNQQNNANNLSNQLTNSNKSQHKTNFHSILQWNCNGYYRRFEELKILLHKFQPSFICLQETHFKNENKPPKVTGYNVYIKNQTINQRASGGVAILVKNNINVSEIAVNSNLQALAITTNHPFKMTICCLYIPPIFRLRNELKNLIDQIPKPFLVVGDLNAKSPMWGGGETDARGKIIENIIEGMDLVCLNNGKPTHFCAATGNHSSIDLSISSPEIAENFYWDSNDDLSGSDHFPIIIKILNSDFNISKRSKWLIDKASLEEWNRFKNALEGIHVQGITIDQKIANLTEQIIDAAKLHIPRSPELVTKPPIPWFNSEIKSLIKQRRKCYKVFKKTKNQTHLQEYRKLKAKIQLIIRRARKESWEKYVGTISASTTTREMWEKIRKIRGKNINTEIHSLTFNNKKVTKSEEILNALGETFSNNSSNENYSIEFLIYKSRKEKRVLQIPEDTKTYNNPITLQELQQTINECVGSSPGPDEIHYEMIKQMNITTLNLLVDLFNEIWNNRTFPESWRTALVVPICKPSKDPTDPLNYRPISLTSCLCKLLERIINKRLVHHLETNCLFSRFQNGFRKFRSTLDNLVRLESDIQEAFAKKEHLIAIFFDLTKAYDMSWAYGMIESVLKMGIGGNMVYFIKNFLQNRKFRVCNGSNVSNVFNLENGTPQGSVISVTLFLIYINNIWKYISISGLMYADDLVIYSSSHDIENLGNTMQNSIKKLEKWSKRSGLIFSTEKTKCIHFCKLRKPHEDPQLKLNNRNLSYVNEHKFLGLIFDKKLSWKTHIKETKTKCQKAMNIIKSLCSKKWGSSRKTLLNVYQSVILSRIDYGAIVYSSACRTSLSSLDPIHNTGIRLSIGAFKTSPVQSILGEAGIPSLTARRHNNIVKYGIKILGNPDHINYTLLRPTYDRKEKKSSMFQFRMILATYNFEISNILTHNPLPIDPQNNSKIDINLSLAIHQKETTHPIAFRNLFKKTSEKYEGYQKYYTDGTKTDQSTGLAVVSSDGNIVKVLRVSEQISIFSAEAYAILEAIKHIHSTLADESVIFTDSLSVLQAINNRNQIRSPIIRLIQNELTYTNKHITLCWIPSHVGITGNEFADKAARDSNLCPINNSYKIPPKDITNYFKLTITQTWQSDWTNMRDNKLRDIKPTIHPWTTSVRRSRREETALCRIRIGHTALTHLHLIKKEEPKECDQCKEAETVNHIIFKCSKYQEERRRNKINENPQIALGDNEKEIQKLFKFIKDINIINQI